MTLESMDLCFIPNDGWLKLKTYYFREKTKSGISLFNQNDSQARTVSNDTEISLHPSSLRLREDNPKYVEFCRFILDSASSLISAGKLEVSDLVKQLAEDKQLVQVKPTQIELALKAYVASQWFVASESGKSESKKIFLGLGQSAREREKLRTFAGSMASELASLSARIRLLVSHAPTVGTYRENILKRVLEKHLPERYHVATGFIYGSDRQIDILIYDRLEYAPLFREADLVVVPPSAVRAVIEVKTNLTTTAFRSSLSLITELSSLDSGYPPIFKGVFAFESDADEDALCKIVKEHHAEEACDADEEGYADTIGRPFDHLTCACVNEKYFIHTRYRRSEGNRYIPALYKAKSHVGFHSQVALFMDELLAYLQFGGAKPGNFQYMYNMLGSDTRHNFYSDLAPENWGPYFFAEHGDCEDAERMDEKVNNVQQWLDGKIPSLPPLQMGEG